MSDALSPRDVEQLISNHENRPLTVGEITRWGAIGVVAAGVVASYAVAQSQIADLRVGQTETKAELRENHTAVLEMRGDMKKVGSDVDWIRKELEKRDGPK